MNRYFVVFRPDTALGSLEDWLNVLANNGAISGYTLVATQRGSRLIEGGAPQTVRLANGDDIMVRGVETGTDFIFERES